MKTDFRLSTGHFENTAFRFETGTTVGINMSLSQSYRVSKQIGSVTTAATPKVGQIGTMGPGQTAHIDVAGRMHALAVFLHWPDVCAVLEEDLEVDTKSIEILPNSAIDDPLLSETLLSIATRGGEREQSYRWIAQKLYFDYSNTTKVATAGAEGRPCPSRVKRVMDLIRSDLTGDLSLQRLAREAAMSPFHFAREFKKSTGLPPHRYVLVQRTNHAIELLSGYECRVADVATASGFANAAHLTRHLSQRFGITPSEIRQMTGQASGQRIKARLYTF